MKKGIAVLIILTILSAVFFTSCEKVPNDGNKDSNTTDPVTEQSTDPPATGSTTDIFPPPPAPVVYNTEVYFAGSTDEIGAKIHQDLLFDKLYDPVPMVINTADNLAALVYEGSSSDLDPQLYNEDFFKTGFILITVFDTPNSTDDYAINVNSYDNDIIVITKVQTYPPSDGELHISEPAVKRVITYNVIPIPYSNQTISYIQS